jgi:gluconolactonase
MQSVGRATVFLRNQEERMSLPLGNLPDTRYPDPRIERLDPRFIYRQGNAAIERIATGFRWAEGPVYFRDGGFLVFSDIPNNRMMRWLEDDGHLSVFRAPSNYANGNTRDREGRLITCEHDARRITRTELDGRITVLIDRFEGKPLNAPNDVVVASDGAVWFTDPGYGIDGPYEGHTAQSELPRQVYRLDPSGGEASVVADDFVRPNGICFSPDERTLYVVDSGISHGGPAHIRAFDVDGARLRNGRVFAADFAPGMTDGIRRQRLVLYGLGSSVGRRCALLCPQRRPDREDSFAGGLRQSLLWREEEGSAVHVCQHVCLCAVCERAWGDGAVVRRPHRDRLVRMQSSPGSSPNASGQVPARVRYFPSAKGYVGRTGAERIAHRQPFRICRGGTSHDAWSRVPADYILCADSPTNDLGVRLGR